MCRLLLVHNPSGLDPAPHLEAFKALSRNSREFQGHGWGCAWLDVDGQWQLYHRIHPVWEDIRAFPTTTLFLAHARSAFRDEGIVVENNMPFSDGRNVFLFNGELQGVRIKAEGRIGAEKIFNTIKRFDRGDPAAAVARGARVINHRTRRIRAMNFFLANSQNVQVYSQFDSEPEYFQLQQIMLGDEQVVCSARYDLGDNSWQPIPNHHQFGISLT